MILTKTVANGITALTRAVTSMFPEGALTRELSISVISRSVCKSQYSTPPPGGIIPIFGDFIVLTEDDQRQRNAYLIVLFLQLTADFDPIFSPHLSHFIHFLPSTCNTASLGIAHSGSTLSLCAILLSR